MSVLYSSPREMTRCAAPLALHAATIVIGNPINLATCPAYSNANVELGKLKITGFPHSSLFVLTCA